MRPDIDMPTNLQITACLFVDVCKTCTACGGFDWCIRGDPQVLGNSSMEDREAEHLDPLKRLEQARLRLLEVR